MPIRDGTPTPGVISTDFSNFPINTGTGSLAGTPSNPGASPTPFTMGAVGSGPHVGAIPKNSNHGHPVSGARSSRAWVPSQSGTQQSMEGFLYKAHNHRTN